MIFVCDVLIETMTKKVNQIYKNNLKCASRSNIMPNTCPETPMVQAMPMPKNTFTELEPVTLPTAASAFVLSATACLLAKRSGRDVPTATNVIAVTES